MYVLQVNQQQKQQCTIMASFEVQTQSRQRLFSRGIARVKNNMRRQRGQYIRCIIFIGDMAK
jgi:hypothetical protein